MNIDAPDSGDHQHVVAATPLIYAALGELVVEKAGRAQPGRRRHDARRRGHRVRRRTGHRQPHAGLRCRGGVPACGLVAAVRIPHADAADQSGRDGPRADAVRRGLDRVRRARLRRRAARWPEAADDSAAQPICRSSGRCLFHYDIIVYLSMVLFVVVQWFLTRTRAGLLMRAVGESPAVAHAIGQPVIGIRYLAVLFGGATAGLAGAYLSTAVDADVGRGHDRGARLDRAGARRVRDVEAIARAARRVSVRRRDGDAALRAGIRLFDPVRVPVDAALRRRRSSCW